MGDYHWQVKAASRFAHEKIGAIIAACGTGKTRAFIRLALMKRLPVLVIAPRNIAQQWKDAIMEIGGPDEDVWVHDAAAAKKHGDRYYEDFIEWLNAGDKS